MSDDDFLPDDEAFDTDTAFETLESEVDSESLVLEEPPLPPLGRSWGFDFASHQLWLVGGRGPLETHGEATLRIWIEKCINTERGAHPIHPDGYGLERPFDLIGQPFSDFAEADYADRITDALTFHPRITDVTDFEFEANQVEEAVAVSFTVIVDDSNELEIQGLTIG